MITYFQGRALGYNILMAASAAVILFGITLGSFVFGERMESQANAALLAGGIDRAIARVLTAVLDAETGQRGYLLAMDDAYLKPLSDARTRYDGEIQTVRAMMAKVPPADTPPGLDRLADLAEQKFAELNHTITLAKTGNLTEAMGMVRTDLGRKLMEDIRETASQLQLKMKDLRMRRAAEMRVSARSLEGFTLVGVLAVVLLSCLGFWAVRSHTRTLEAAQLMLKSSNEDLERRVLERTQGLARANDELQRYAYIISHDLRAPLVNIMGFTSEMETAAATVAGYVNRTAIDPTAPDVADVLMAAEQDIPEAIGFIRSSSSRMDGLISEILKLSRLGRVQRVATPVNVGTVVEDCIANLQHRLDVAGATVAVQGSLPTIVTDVSMLQQILANLLDNAVKYLDPDRPGVITIAAKRVGLLTIFDIDDNGRGISPTDHERIFELFRRSGVQDRPGDGIGLAHVRTLVRRLGGDITVKSDGRTGTLFRFSIASDLQLLGKDETA